MRTLNELLQVAKQAEADYKARVASADQELKAETEAAHKAQADAGAAIASGDQNAYAKAMREDEYHRGRAAMLKKQHIKPQLTPEENNAIAEEANKVYMQEMRSLYGHLYELAEDWEKTIHEIKLKSETLINIGRHLREARLKDWQLDRMLPDERPFENRQYIGTHSGGVSDSLSRLMSNEVYTRIRDYYIPQKKEAAAHE